MSIEEDCKNGKHVPCVMVDNLNRPFEVICQNCTIPMTKEDYENFFGSDAAHNIRWNEKPDPEYLAVYFDSDNIEGWRGRNKV